VERLSRRAKIVEAEYYAPLLAHASMEPPAALAVYRDGKVEHGRRRRIRKCARRDREAVGLKKEDVTVNVTLLGGGFGRKSFPDFAVSSGASKKTGKPGKWSGAARTTSSSTCTTLWRRCT